MTDSTLEQQAPATTPRHRRTDAERLADMQAELARLKAAAEAKTLAANEVSAAAGAPKPARARTTRVQRPRTHAEKPVQRDENNLDSELRELVESFVAALRDVIRRELMVRATSALKHHAK